MRVVSDNAVYPGELSPEDHAEQAVALFTIVNIIVEQMISQPKRISALYDKLSKDAINTIQRRDEA